MKYSKYQILAYSHRYNQDTDAVEKVEELVTVTAQYSEEAEATAKQTAYNGQYTIEDDGRPEPAPAPTGDPVTWDELDAAYQAGYEEGYTEGVNGAYDQ